MQTSFTCLLQTSLMVLLNGIINFPGKLADRVALRKEAIKLDFRIVLKVVLELHAAWHPVSCRC